MSLGSMKGAGPVPEQLNLCVTNIELFIRFFVDFRSFNSLGKGHLPGKYPGLIPQSRGEK